MFPGGFDPSNPQMQELLARLQSDPRVMAALSRPGVMERVMAAGNDPTRLSQLLQEPELAPLLPLLQQQAGFPRPQVTQPVNPWSSSSSANVASTDGGVTEVRDLSHYRRLLSSSADRFVVVDCFATWCGPCQRVAPEFARLARTYRRSGVFIKVDVDKCRDVAQLLQVRAMPTFLFFQNGTQVAKVQGANVAELTRVCSRLSVRREQQQVREVPSPFRHFPAREGELATFAKVKVPSVLARMESVLKEAEATTLRNDVAALADVGNWHNREWSPESLEIVLRALQQFSLADAVPFMQVTQLLMLHPCASKQLNGADFLEAQISLLRRAAAKQNVAQAEENSALQFESDAASDKVVGMSTVTLLRAWCNALCRRALAEACVAKLDAALDAVALCEPFASATLAESEQPKYRVLRASAAAFLLNAAALVRQHEMEDSAVVALSLLAEPLLSEKVASVLYTVAVATGTLLFRNESAVELAHSLGLKAAVDQRLQTGGLDDQCTQALRELKRVLVNPKQ